MGLRILAVILAAMMINQPGMMAGDTNAAPGIVETIELPDMNKVAAAARNLELKPDEFAIWYYRPDGNYKKWNLWLWRAGGTGSRYEFTGVVDGVAYFRYPTRKFFSADSRAMNIIVRTDEWKKDPGVDQSYCLDWGPQIVIFSGNPGVFPVGENRPRILTATVHEPGTGDFQVRIKLSARYGLAAAPGDNQFMLDNGLTVIDAFNATNRQNNYTDDILLNFTGTIDYNTVYHVRHPAFGQSPDLAFPRPPAETPELPQSARNRLPEPVLDNHPEWIELYWAAWKFMHEKITAGNQQNGFAKLYIDEGFNENIYQWDSCFMVAYAMYGLYAFPVMATLDNFYNHQRQSDGYICRCYNENTGRMTGENDINPPLFAWMEWRYYRMTGDSSRIRRVLKVLDKYFTWCRDYARSPFNDPAVPGSNELYFITDLGSGMDNSPRGEFIGSGAWIDLASQQAMAALYMSRLARVVSDRNLQKKYYKEYETIKKGINNYLWHDEHQIYYDRTESGQWHTRKTIASFWPMLAEVTDKTRATALIEKHLKNPEEFYRPHLFPTLANNDPAYSPWGNYWRGGVWAPTTYVVIKGIERYDRRFAYQAAVNHLYNLSKVYQEFDPKKYQFKMPGLTEPNIPRNGNGLKQIWEAYAPEVAAPATRWDANLLVRQKFCGWSGLGPVALLIENVIGLDFNAPANTVTWRINLLEQHGLKRFELGNNTITLLAAGRARFTDPVVITVNAEKKFHLVVYLADATVPIIDRVITAGANQTITPSGKQP